MKCCSPTINELTFGALKLWAYLASDLAVDSVGAHQEVAVHHTLSTLRLRELSFLLASEEGIVELFAGLESDLKTLICFYKGLEVLFEENSICLLYLALKKKIELVLRKVIRVAVSEVIPLFDLSKLNNPYLRSDSPLQTWIPQTHEKHSWSSANFWKYVAETSLPTLDWGLRSWESHRFWSWCSAPLDGLSS